MTTPAVRCPLCGETGNKPSWLGAARFQETSYRYLECKACGSHYCQPMPDAHVLAALYGPAYQDSVLPGDDPPDTGGPDPILAWISRMPPGTLVDYGCGRGHLLLAAAARGWKVLGIELDRSVAGQTQERINLPVCSVETLDTSTLEADIVHLGDVIEHLPEPDACMPSVIGMLKPDGILLAQGPLEGNPTVFTFGVRLIRALRSGHTTDNPPYHVIQATERGQRRFFERWGFSVLEFHSFEVDWPAPSRLAIRDVQQPRRLALFLLRRVSRALSPLSAGHWGNRYFFAGKRECTSKEHGIDVTRSSMEPRG